MKNESRMRLKGVLTLECLEKPSVNQAKIEIQQLDLSLPHQDSTL